MDVRLWAEMEISKKISVKASGVAVRFVFWITVHWCGSAEQVKKGIIFEEQASRNQSWMGGDCYAYQQTRRTRKTPEWKNFMILTHRCHEWQVQKIYDRC